MVPLCNAGEFSGQPFSAMNKRLYSFEASFPLAKHIYECL